MDEDEIQAYEPEERELTLCYLLTVVDSILEQVRWLKVVIEEELERSAEDERAA